MGEGIDGIPNSVPHGCDKNQRTPLSVRRRRPFAAVPSRFAHRSELLSDFVIGHFRKPLDLDIEMVIQIVKNSRAPGREAQDHRAAESVVSNEYGTLFAQFRPGNGCFDSGQGDSGKSVQPIRLDMKCEERRHGKAHSVA